jgi:hypothetical protein
MRFEIHEGKRGGKYFLDEQGRKVYVARNTKSSAGAKSPIPKRGGKKFIGKTQIGARHVAAWTPKENRQYEHVKESEMARGQSEKDATRIAAATVNKDRALHGETRT